ncbi:hypothetical protein M1N21_03195 [Dehalococcoidia bacterium]|nr:hypothetical protein [Dehalococcoidia bacterium]
MSRLEVERQKWRVRRNIIYGGPAKSKLWANLSPDLASGKGTNMVGFSPFYSNAINDFKEVNKQMKSAQSGTGMVESKIGGIALIRLGQ